MTASIDRRIRRTQTNLAQSLISLTLEKGYAAVTIRDITEHAHIGYATFFRHYADKEALLSDVLMVFIGELTARLRVRPGQEMTIEAMLSDGTTLFEYLYSHQELSRLLLSSYSLKSLIWQIQRSDAIALLPPASETGIIPAEVLNYHVIGSILVLIQWWFANDMPYSPERMAQIYTHMIMQPAQQIIQGLPFA